MVSLLLKILCKSPTGQTSGFPGSVRRMRAGSVTMVFNLARNDASGSLSRMVLPYDFDILRPSVPGSLAAGVSRGFGSGKTSLELIIGGRPSRTILEPNAIRSLGVLSGH